jgi:hypothetical protein
LCKKVIDELNITFGNHNNIKLELVAWETHTYPSVGIDAQSVINKQIGDNYDIFLGIMWNRFGTPTTRADSGTEEEFENAYSKFINNESEVNLLFYFKDTAKNLSSINIEQLMKVNTFKTKLKEKGVYFKYFTETDEFETLIRFALTSILQGYNSNINKKEHNINIKAEEVISLDAEKMLDDIDDIGFLESLDLATLSMQESQKSVIKMIKYMNDLSTNIGIQTKKISDANSKPIKLQGSALRKLVDQTAKIMANFNNRMKAEIPVNGEHFSNGIGYYNIAILTFSQFSVENTKTLDDISSLKEALKYAKSSIFSMRDSISIIPTFTTNFGKAKKESVKILTELMNEFQTHINLVDQLEINIKGLISESND